VRPLLAACLTILSFASCDRFRGPQTAFDAEAAMALVKAQLDFGPRVPGTEAARRTGDWIVAELKKRVDSVEEQRFSYHAPGGDSVPMRNIIAHINPKMVQRVLYVTHWDTRPKADSDPNLGNRNLPIPGANDGASGVALLIEVADALKKTPANVGVDLLFVDGEDWGSFDTYSAESPPANPEVLIGSTYFANHLPPGYKPLYGVLWDMIGDAYLDIEQETNSINQAPEVVTRVWQTAADLGYGKYFLSRAYGAITDDHVPLLRKGLRVIDVIDINYGPPDSFGNPFPNYHHTMQDTIDKVSAKSLQIVGDVAVALVTK
jgi:glutaminyl-peptide cyclotransferase